MIKVIFNSLTLKNFKGIRDLHIDFNEDQTNINGANRSGKTSVADGWHYLLFGKDSSDRATFDIKNTKYPELNRQDHEVSGVISVDGRKESLKRVYREKWTKKQGSELREFTGNETLYFWNEVPLNAGEYKAKIESIMQESLFKLLTNPLYFNQALKWNERRAIIEKMAGSISDADVAGDNESYKKLLLALENKSLEDYKKQIVSKKKLLKDILKDISPRIDENIKNLPEPFDFDTIEKEISKLNADINIVDDAMANKTKAHQDQFQEIQGKQTKLHQLISANNDLAYKIETEIRTAQNKKASSLSSLKAAVDSINENLTSKKALWESKKQTNVRIESDMTSLREGWAKDKEREFVYDESKFACPTCNRDFETDDIEETKLTMKKNFDDETARILEIVNGKGFRLKKELEDNQLLIKTIEGHIVQLEKDLLAAEEAYTNANDPEISIDLTIKNAINENKEHIDRKAEIEALTTEVSEANSKPVNLDDLKEKRLGLVERLDTQKSHLSVREDIKKINNRIADLKNEEKNLSKELAEMEGIEFTIDEFSAAKVAIVEERTNGLFKYTKFKMFNVLINEGVEPTCQSIWEGVPFESLNTEGKLNCGLDIINSLSDFFGFTAPIIADNRESVTEIIEVKAQMINLIVSPEDKELRIA